MIDPKNLPKDKDLAKQILESDSQAEREKRNIGFLGRFFGRKDVAPFYISGLVLFLLVLFLVLFCFFGKESASLTKKDLVTFILPTITTIIGYFFGQKNTNLEK